MRVGGVVAAVLVCATLVGAGMTVQQTTGASDIDVFTPEKRVTSGEETQLPLVVTNDGSEPASAATDAGAAIYRPHDIGYVYVRHAKGEGHTWPTDVGRFLEGAREQWLGLLRHPDFGT